MSKRPSLKKQVCDALYAQARFGQSKHQAKQEEKRRCEKIGEPWNPARVDGIFSIGTMKAYREECIRFTDWAKEQHGCRWLNEAKEHVSEYLQNGVDRGLSPWTMKKQAAALRKMYKDSELGKEINLPKRELANISRSRGKVEMDKKIDLEKYKPIIDFCKATGLRRHEVESIKAGQVDFKTGKILNVKGKGGRVRDVTIRQDMLEHIKGLVQDKNASELIFERIPVRLDVHSYRREYVQARYVEEAGREFVSGDYDKRAVMRVSNDMGHGRINVILDHYLK
ncbi:MAG TPA: site-specific integrase [Thermoanaerobacterales bacterium]|nr:site-specific integrase [Thermoanaerobacterales bacterium]